MYTTNVDIVPHSEALEMKGTDFYIPLYGTGDVFASVLTGGLVKGESLPAAARRAAEFVRACAVRTVEQDLPLSEGVDFEPLLGSLMDR